LNTFLQYKKLLFGPSCMLSVLYAIARPSVRLSHEWIRKRLKLGLWNFYR